ncbi:MAG: hypothetical protein AAGA45_01635 [Verrucomicrobiota bacterium]
MAALFLSACGQEEPESYRIPKDQGNQASTTPSATPPATPQATPEQPQTGMTVLPGMAEQASAFTPPPWKVPESWKAQPLGPMRKGSWKVPGEYRGEAEVSVFAFPDQAGSDLANVNRWRSQVGLGPITEGQLRQDRELYTLTAGEATGFYVTMDGPGGQSTVAAIVPITGATWYFKLSGDTFVVNERSAQFLEFVSSSQF